MSDTNDPFAFDEFAVELTWPDGKVQYSSHQHTAELASEYLDSKPADVTGRIVKRTVTTTAWEAT